MKLFKNPQRKTLNLLGVALTMVVLAACSGTGTEAPELNTAGYSDGGKFIALNDNNTLVLFDGGRSYRSGSSDFTFRRVVGVTGNLLGIDYRPANDKLYGLTSTNNVYTIDPYSGRATFVSTLSVPFGGGGLSGFDFNPVVDRLRLTGTNDQNYRVNVDTGATLVDGTLRYSQGDRNQGRNPSITGSAYTNSVAGATTTMLYGIDYQLDVLVTQNPANDGLLQTVGGLDVNFGSMVGFNIVAGGYGGSYGGSYGGGSDYTGYAVTNSRLYNIDLGDGDAERVKDLPSGNYRGLAVMPGGNRY